MGNTYLITYKKRGEKDTSLAEVSGMLKLLNWIAENANQCDTVLIQREDA
jgi:hypothetical protein